MQKIKVGILEDELPQAEILMSWLVSDGYQVAHAANGSDFIDMVAVEEPDILILDWQLPDTEGIDVLQRLRGEGVTIPILFATAKNSEQDIVEALQSGADDYLVKPLREQELLARLAAIWRRLGDTNNKKQAIRLGPIEIIPDEHRVLVDGEDVKLTSTEFKLASCVLSNEGKMLSRDFLLSEVWGIGANLDTRTVDMHMSRIRRLLQINAEMGYCIKTIYRHGYRLEKL